MATRIGFTGDVMLGRGVDQRQRRGDRAPVDVWGDVLGDLVALDALVVNLECCLSERGERWTRTHRPFHFRAHPDWASTALAEAGVDCCALANNHLFDYEEEALLDTLDTLDDAGISWTGAGRTLDEALEPAVVEVEDSRISVISLTDNTPEFAADETTPGTAYVAPDPDDDRTRRLVEDALARAAATKPALVVASVHLGPNMLGFPSDRHVEFAHYLVDQGVDIVHGHSAHVFQGIEQYDDALILHDTGDFVDDYAVDESLRNDRGFLYELRLEDARPSELHLHPTLVRDRQVTEPTGDRSWWLEALRHRSEPFHLPNDFTWDTETITYSLEGTG